MIEDSQLVSPGGRRRKKGAGRGEGGGKEGRREMKGTERGEGSERKKVKVGEERGKKGGGYPHNISLVNDSVPYLCHVLCHKVDGVGIQSYSNEAHQVCVSQGAVRK